MVEGLQILENSVIIGAHPDDELLWFGSILDKVDQVILVYEDFWPLPPIGPARQKVVENFPRDRVMSLKIPEAATYGCGDWMNPVLTSYGMELSQTVLRRNLKQGAKRLFGKSNAPRDGIRATYQANHGVLLEKLRKVLSKDMNVFTHNPWGEYGHEEHIQVFRVVDRLRTEIGFKLWMSNYCTERSLALAATYFVNQPVQSFEFPVNKVFAEQVAQVYRDHGCWTWDNKWVWFDTERFMEAPRGQTHLNSQGHLFPLNMFNIGPTQ